MDQQLTYESAVKKGIRLTNSKIRLLKCCYILYAAQLVERNPQFQVDPLRVSMHDEVDVINLAKQIQSADEQLKHSTSQKLVVILDQVGQLITHFSYVFGTFKLCICFLF